MADDGLTIEQHLLSHWRQSGVIPAQLDLPPIPFELEHVWEWWNALDKTRQNGMSTNPISYTELANWANLLKINITPLEVRCIIALDSAYLGCLGEQRSRKESAANK